MSGALVRKTITHAHWDPLHKVNEYGIYWADAVDLHIASLKREHEQQLAALQAEREDAQASFQHALKYSGECNTKLAALEADRDRLLAVQHVSALYRAGRCSYGPRPPPRGVGTGSRLHTIKLLGDPSCN
jgi:hypothetical protein